MRKIVAVANVALCYVAIILVASPNLAADPLPERWLKTMTNDPETNPILQKYAEKLDDPKAETIRELTLLVTLSKLCDGASLNREDLVKFEAASPLNRASPAEFADAKRKASASLDYFDYRDLAHLCSGAAYLFGSSGVLGQHLINAGNGLPSLPFDPKNPYLPFGSGD